MQIMLLLLSNFFPVFILLSLHMNSNVNMNESPLNKGQEPWAALSAAFPPKRMFSTLFFALLQVIHDHLYFFLKFHQLQLPNDFQYN